VRLYDAVNNVLKRLDDYPSVAGERVWTRAELELYVQDGYNAFCRRTKCVFDFFYPENLSTAGNYVAKWEENYFDPGMIAVGLLNYSGGYWEQDYSEPGAIGPANHTQPWESAYLTHTFVVSRGVVPEDNVTVDRGTNDYIDLDPEYSRWYEEHDRNYQTVGGTPQRFAMDRDGIGSMRMVPAGSADATEYDVEGAYGLLRLADDADGLGTWAPVGTWGGLREIPEHFRMGGQYGIPRRQFSDLGNTRIEYFRLGKDLNQYQFEIPERFAKYVEHYAQSKALERDGPGQDLVLSQHFMQRFDDGVGRMVRRLGEHRRSRLAAIGAAGKKMKGQGLARLPWQYGRQIRKGY
jgi:hypothetical protein